MPTVYGLAAGDRNCVASPHEDGFYVALVGNEAGLLILPASMETPNASRDIFFRSDSRDPGGEIFPNGFHARMLGDARNNAASRPVFRGQHQDIDHYSAVCFSALPEAAALFPAKVPGLPTPEAETWLYAFCPANVYHTVGIQGVVAFEGRGVRARYRAKAKVNLYARESCTMHVAGAEVILAMRISRSWAGQDYFAGGQWKVSQKLINPAAPQMLKDLLADHVHRFPLGQKKNLARPDEGALTELDTHAAAPAFG